MRMLYEIRDLRFATPATVSRAGILFISDISGYQWKNYYKQWIKSQNFKNNELTEQLNSLFEKYIPETFDYIKKFMKFIVPVVEISMVVNVCKFVQSVLSKQEVKGLEFLFVFACVWAIGAGFSEKDGKDFRKDFSNWWKDKYKTIKFPTKDTVFDYYVDLDASKLEEWAVQVKEQKVPDIDTSKAIPNYTIPTSDTVSIQYFMQQYISVDHPPLLVGNAGCGKTQIAKGLLRTLSLNTEAYQYQIINFNYYTDSELLQTIMEQILIKRGGSTFAPPGKAKLIYYVDDLNMPKLDPYDTQTAIALLRQHIDYSHIYDRQKMLKKDIVNTMYLAAMNPTAGSFYVNLRLQRHFWLCAIPFPEQKSLLTIYQAYLNKHFTKFKQSIQENINLVIKATLNLHQEVEKNFKKTAINFHYEFNVRHLTNVFQGLLVAKPEAIKEPDNFVRLWTHESERIYGDRLITSEDLTKFRNVLGDIVKKNFARYNMNKYFADNPEPLVFAHFVAGLEENMYD